MHAFLSGVLARAHEAPDGDVVARAQDLGERVDGLARVALASRVLCAVAFLLWFYRAHEWVQMNGPRRLERSSGWAVGSFFVPFLNLVLPCIAMMDVWGGSHANAGPEAPGRPKRGSGSGLVLLWWFSFLGASILAGVAGALTGATHARSGPVDPHPIDTLMTAVSWMLASRIAEVVAAAVAIALVVRVSALQARSAERLAAVFE